jgi:hypothetical protein
MCCWSDPSEPYNLSQKGTLHLNLFSIISAVLRDLFILFSYELTTSVFFCSFSSRSLSRSYIPPDLPLEWLFFWWFVSRDRAVAASRGRGDRRRCRSSCIIGKISAICLQLRIGKQRLSEYRRKDFAALRQGMVIAFRKAHPGCSGRRRESFLQS